MTVFQKIGFAAVAISAAVICAEATAGLATIDYFDAIEILEQKHNFRQLKSQGAQSTVLLGPSDDVESVWLQANFKPEDFLAWGTFILGTN